MLTRRQWADRSLELFRCANQLCEQDKGTGEPLRFRLGHYFYSIPIAAAKVQDEASKSGDGA